MRSKGVSGAGASNTVSLGNGIGYGDLSLSRDGNDLILTTGENESLTFKDWYAGKANVLDLQVILDATTAFDANSQDPMFNRKVQRFDFLGIVQQFDQALAQTPGLTSWALTNALIDFHLSGSDDAAANCSTPTSTPTKRSAACRPPSASVARC